MEKTKNEFESGFIDESTSRSSSVEDEDDVPTVKPKTLSCKKLVKRVSKIKKNGTVSL